MTVVSEASATTVEDDHGPYGGPFGEPYHLRSEVESTLRGWYLGLNDCPCTSDGIHPPNFHEDRPLRGLSSWNRKLAVQKPASYGLVMGVFFIIPLWVSNCCMIVADTCYNIL